MSTELPTAWKPFAKPETIPTGPVVTPDQLELVRKAVANGATADELKLYLFDCARQGVHPLDKLVHFTKRQGKYTPITSIDFMRIRAAETNEYAGSDDAQFQNEYTENGLAEQGYPKAASVTVWRLVQGTRCPFTATARWNEYKPEPGTSGRGDVMWRKMPHTMLAKCAEALALRKGFPRQLAGLYAREEMDQAGPTDGYSVEAPTARGASEATPSEPNGGGSAPSNYRTSQHLEPGGLADGQLRIERVDTAPTKNKNVTKARITLSTGEVVSTINNKLTALCEGLCQDGTPVTIETRATKWGADLIAVHPCDTSDDDDAGAPPLDDSDIPF